MPIPQVDKKKKTKPESARDASSVRKKRAQERKGKKPEKELPKSRKKTRVLNDRTEKKKKGSKPGEKGEKTGKDGKKKKGKKGEPLPKWKKVLKIGGIIGVFFAGLGLIGIAAAYAWVSQDLADITDLEDRAVDETTKIYDRSGEILLYEVGDNKHINVPFEDVNPQVWQALLALEDRRFYEHSGFDPIGIARAVLNIRSLETAQGASTLTQQFVGNAILTRERTIDRKVKELILAIRLEQKYEKDEILEFYLNEVYFGNNQQGVEAAAQDYFGKSAKDVSLAEAATLASIPKNPPRMLADPERLDSRRDYALDVMVEEGYITEEEAEAAKQEDIPLAEPVADINAPHFVFYVREYLEDKYGQNTVRRGGLKVTTTLDWNKQEIAESAIADNIGNVDNYGGSNAALVAIDPHSGQVHAMVGSRDYYDTENDGQVNVTTSLRQPGSSIKPLAYLAAFEKGYTPDTKVFDLVTDFPSLDGGPNYQPLNYDLGTRGAVSLRSALATSLNIPAVKVLYLVGVQEFIDFAERFGYSSFTDRSRYGLAMVLGGAEVSLLEHTAAFATFAREGEYRKATTVLSVEDNTGTVIEEWEDSPQQAVDAGAARTLNSVLSDQGARGYTFSGLNLSDRPVAAKTGTTNDYRDAWTMGYTPSLAAGVWVGNNDNSEMYSGAAGLVVAAPIWNDFMERTLSGTPVEYFQQAEYQAANSALAGSIEQGEERTVDRFSGDLVPDECINTYPAEYTEKRELKEPHSILYFIDRTNPTGPPPADPAQDPMFNSWEGAVRGWSNLEDQQEAYLSDSTPTVDCSVTSDNQAPEVEINSPVDGNTYTSKSGFTFSADVVPGTSRKITSITFQIDGFTVDSISGEYGRQTVTSGYSAQNLTSGNHTATVVIKDDRDNTTSETVEFDFKENAGSNNNNNSDKKNED